MTERLWWLICPACQRRALQDAAGMLQQLRAVGMLRREAEPEPAMLDALIGDGVSRMTCHQCQHQGLIVEVPDPLSGEDWQEARPCEVCGVVLPAERLEVFPDTTVCVACQEKSDRGEVGDVREFCPRCGSIMTLRATRGDSLRRYRMVCPQCGV